LDRNNTEDVKNLHKIANQIAKSSDPQKDVENYKEIHSNLMQHLDELPTTHKRIKDFNNYILSTINGMIQSKLFDENFMFDNINKPNRYKALSKIDMEKVNNEFDNLIGVLKKIQGELLLPNNNNRNDRPRA